MYREFKIITLITVISFFLLVGFAQAGQWVDVNGQKTKNGLISGRKGGETNIVVSDSGKIFAAYQDKKDQVFVKEFIDNNWSFLPSGSFADYVARNGDKASLAVDGENVYIAYKDLDAKKRARVKKWDGVMWSDLSDAGHLDGYVSDLGGFEPVLCLDKTGDNLYAAFRDEVSGERIKVMKWSESFGWNNVSDPNNSDGLISDSFASEVDVKASKSNQEIFFAYEDLANRNRIRVKKWDGSNWSDLSDGSHPEGYASDIAGFSPSIDTDGSGNLYLAYTGKNNKNTYIHKWDGNHWEDVGGGIAVRGRTIESTIIIDERGYLYLAYSQKDKNKWHVRAKVWDGLAWLDAKDGKSKNISKGKGKGDPSLAAFENKIYMSFTDARNRNRARIKMLNFE